MEEDEDQSEEERRVKRSLIVPKIYIKKPLGGPKKGPQSQVQGEKKKSEKKCIFTKNRSSSRCT